MKILGIESSCDETSAAVVEDGKTILSNIVYSQVEIHKPYNGVVPEIASRNHLIKILGVLDSALAGMPISGIDAVAVTNGPGLIGSLLVGLSAAKGISFSLSKPLIPVNHVEAHMYAPHLFNSIEFPYIGLVASGGHTLLYLVKGFDSLELIGTTIDDAVGEAYDKVAKLLGLGYPGGPVIDKMARLGNPDIEEFRDMPRLLPDTGNDRYNFSYSGLKTAIAYRLKRVKNIEQSAGDVAAVFQKSAVELLCRKSKNALCDFGIKRLVVSGGVAANSLLREELDKLKSRGIEVYTAPVEFCSDNAAMVAGRGYCDFIAGRTGNLRTEAYSRLPLLRRGKRLSDA
ncbi:MAG: tRNA (adenosine(37)-N6)-threonylcarbamoyltransferase complex transferase subunit TsaD [Brevinematales bacterium]|jgi:N6-L-threonylcarbamoyladenine synthase